MKLTKLMLKIAAAILAAAAVTCCVLANLDRITDGIICLREKLAEKRYCMSCCDDDEPDEFEDWDD